jgi:hypothetical protein
LSLFASDLKTEINISDFLPGTYFINVMLKEENYRYKILKQ